MIKMPNLDRFTMPVKKAAPTRRVRNSRGSEMLLGMSMASRNGQGMSNRDQNRKRRKIG